MELEGVGPEVREVRGREEAALKETGLQVTGSQRTGEPGEPLRDSGERMPFWNAIPSQAVDLG